MTREEYKQHTNIQDAEEAKSLMKRIKILFACTFIGIIGINILRAISSNIEGITIYLLGYLLLYAYFIYRCYEITKKTKKVTRAEIVFSFFFAPISWIWFYDALLEPLQVITGERDVPDHIRIKKELTEEQKKTIRRNTWKTIGKITLVAFCMVTVMVVAVILMEL